MAKPTPKRYEPAMARFAGDWAGVMIVVPLLGTAGVLIHLQRRNRRP